jgi:multiple sugar transport system substrate-binding protein
MKHIRPALVMCLSMAACLFLSACGGATPSFDTADTANTTEYVLQPIDGYDGCQVRLMNSYAKRVFTACTNENGDYQLLCDGKLLCEAQADFLCPTNNGVWTIKQNGENEIDIQRLSLDGESVANAALTTCDIHGAVGSKQGGIYLYTAKEIMELDSFGKQIKSYECPSEGISRLITNEEDDVFLCTYDRGELTVSTLEGEKSVTISGAKDLSVFNGSGKFDFYVYDDRGIFGVEDVFGTPQIKQLLSWGDSAIAYDSSWKICAPTESEFCVQISDEIFSLSPIDDQTESEDIVRLVLAANGQSNLQNYVSGYNASQNKYYVEVTDYSDGAASNGAVTRLNTELISGAGPDLIDFETFQNKSFYAQKGYLTDLMPFFEKDLNPSDYPLLKVLSEGESLFYAPAGYAIMTAYGTATYFDDQQVLSIKDYLQIEKALPDVMIMCSLGQEDLLGNLLRDYIPDNLDWENASCSFDTPELMEILKIVKGIENSKGLGEQAELGQDYVLASAFINNPTQIKQLEEKTGQEISFVGWPTTSGKPGSYLYLAGVVGINRNSKAQDAAWDFVKYIISSPDVQESLLGTMFPVCDTVLETRLDYMLDPYAEFEGKEITVNSDGTFNVDGVYQDRSYDPSPEITQEQVQKLRNLISSAVTMYDYDPQVYSIIHEEANTYFAGQKTVEQATQTIQQRVSLYVAEQG